MDQRQRRSILRMGEHERVRSCINIIIILLRILGKKKNHVARDQTFQYTLIVLLFLFIFFQ
jgi:hypothetical protein